MLELHTRALARLGPDILASPPDLDAMLARMRRADGDAAASARRCRTRRSSPGIGNMWMAESLWRARLSPWPRLADVPEADRRRALETAATLMRASVDAGREPRKQVHGRAGRPCSALRHADPLARPGRREPHGRTGALCQPGRAVTRRARHS